MITTLSLSLLLELRIVYSFNSAHLGIWELSHSNHMAALKSAI